MVAWVGGDQPRLQRRVQPRRVRRQPRAPQPHTALDSTVLALNIEKYLLVPTSPSPAAATPSISWPLVSVTLSLSAASSRLCFTLTPATSPPPASTTARLTCCDTIVMDMAKLITNRGLYGSLLNHPKFWLTLCV